ncbi:hypothetical protein TWF281_007523 [Arthrobotrys megalospora]
MATDSPAIVCLASSRGLEDLPFDLKLCILEECDPDTFISLVQTCHSFYDLYHTPFGSTIGIKTLKHRLGEAGWTLYLIKKVQEKRAVFGADINNQLESSRAEDVSLDPREVLEQFFPAEAALKEVEASNENPTTLVKDLYEIFRIVNYFTNRYRTFEDKMKTIDALRERDGGSGGANTSQRPKPRFRQVLSRLDDQELGIVICEYWLAVKLFGAHTCKEWSTHLKLWDKSWLPNCEAIFGDRESYDQSHVQFRRIRATRDFIALLVACHLTSCSDWLLPSLAFLEVDQADEASPPEQNIESTVLMDRLELMSKSSSAA